MKRFPAAYEEEEIWPSWSEKLLDWDLDFHGLLLGDDLRMRSYERAIREAVRPGAVVLDLGTGTGVLARWALDAGASRVYGIERDEALLERTVASFVADGVGHAFVPLAGFSYDVEVPEPVELIISEILGNLVDNEDCCRILEDARRRFLQPKVGRLLPRRVERYLVPVDAARAHSAVAASGNDATMRRPFDAYYDVVLPRAGYLSSARVDRIFCFEGDPTSYRSELVFPVDRGGVFTGFKGWFVADLSATVALDISGDRIGDGADGGRTTSDSWKHAYLPVEEPVAVEIYDRICLTFERTSLDDRSAELFAHTYRWKGAVWRGERVVGRFSQSAGRMPDGIGPPPS